MDLGDGQILSEKGVDQIHQLPFAETQQHAAGSKLLTSEHGWFN
jgi:hypothetical protein